MLTWAWVFLTAITSLASANGASQRVKEINQAHDEALFSADAPYLLPEITSAESVQRFAKDVCGLDSRAPAAVAPFSKALNDCDRRFKRSLTQRLAEKYFATDRKAIELRCKREELACMDPKILEFWIRTSHNEEIEKSRAEKLAFSKK